MLQRADVLPHFPAFRMHIFGFPVLAAGNLRQNSHTLRLDHRLMEEISKFCGVSSFIWATILSRESKRILPRSKSLLNFDASSPSVCGACSIWVITACWICANSSGFIVRNFASAVGKTPCNAPTRMKAVYHCFAKGSPCPTDAPRSLETQTRHSPTVLRYATDCRTTAVRSAPTESYRLSWCIHRSQSVQISLPVRSRCCYQLFKDDGLFFIDHDIFVTTPL